MFYIATAVLLELFLGIFDFHQSDKNDYIIGSDNFWSAFCVFHAPFREKTQSFKICALKNPMIFDN